MVNVKLSNGDPRIKRGTGTGKIIKQESNTNNALYQSCPTSSDV